MKKKGKKSKINKINSKKNHQSKEEAEVAPGGDEMVATAPLDEDETAAIAPADNAIVEPTSMTDPDIEEYSQPEYSPYEGLPVTVMIGLSQKRYSISRSLVDKFPALRNRLQTTSRSYYDNYSMQEEDYFPTLTLSDVNEDIGHTFIHILYTGNLETVKIPSDYDQPKRTREYTRGVLTYRAAMTHGLSKLEDLAKQYMAKMDPNITIFEIISLAQENFPVIADDDWYSDYLTARILSAFDADDGVFQQEAFFKNFGNSAEFDKFLAKTMVLAYSQKLSALRCESPPISASAADSVPGNEVGNNIVQDEHRTAGKFDDDDRDGKFAETKPIISSPQFSLSFSAQHGNAGFGH